MGRGYPLSAPTYTPAQPTTTFSQPWFAPGAPANDNSQRPGNFANDNFPKPGDSRVPAAKEQSFRYQPTPKSAAGVFSAFRQGSRSNAIGFIANLAYDALSAWDQAQQLSAINNAGWETFCPVGGWGGITTTNSAGGGNCIFGTGDVNNSFIFPGPMYQISADKWGITWAQGWTFSSLGPNFNQHDGLTNWEYQQQDANSGQPLDHQQYAPYIRLGGNASPGARPLPKMKPGALSPVLSPNLRVPPMWAAHRAPIASAQPSPVEIPIPWKLIPRRIFDPFEVAPYRTDFGYRLPPQRSGWDAVAQPNGAPSPRPGLRPTPRDIEITPRAPIAHPRPRHALRRPPPKDKEVKAKAQGARAAKIIGDAFGKITEASDFVDNIWDALPESLRKAEMRKRHGKKPKLTDKMQQIYDHAGEIDIVEAIDNIAKDHLQDAVFGWFGKKAGEAAKRDGRATGYSITRIGKGSMR